MACAACHIDGINDGVSWDLGDRGGKLEVVRDRSNTQFTMHPMKGPMFTQTLQGMNGTDPHHWRGDRGGRRTSVGWLLI